MAGSTRVPEAEITGVHGVVPKRITRRMFGEVPEPLEVMRHHRPVLRTSLGLGLKATRWNRCDKDLKSYAHMAVASLTGCAFCLDLGCFRAHNGGLDESKAREVPRWREPDVFTPLERDVMEYAEAMSRTPPTVTGELSARLLERLGASRAPHVVSVSVIGHPRRQTGGTDGRRPAPGGPARRRVTGAAVHRRRAHRPSSAARPPR
ncbi:carboxymuconolactone decarboxylase family protein [Thermobifida halotolerans]|uniref:Carboxymuconolactone decarboxylase family protein n=1 Tax=Thermobifida halotolerans TaxID=483545 RepID=A0AA97LZD8_9ACTN|nr:carboxymuconolactone decarboxylase family protein [Thermobifida halotolerans]UOE21097.1 carboxymuconolactone decarboxylase family protein [Thermobifida halotolerans]